MSAPIELVSILKGIIKLLYDEKEALLNNDGHIIAEIIEKKNEYLEKLKEFKGIDASSDERVISLVEEINSLQETNLLLTKQALGYQEMLMESIAKNIKNISNTYSPKGGYSKNSNNVNFIDQSV